MRKVGALPFSLVGGMFRQEEKRALAPTQKRSKKRKRSQRFLSPGKGGESYSPGKKEKDWKRGKKERPFLIHLLGGEKTSSLRGKKKNERWGVPSPIQEKCLKKGGKNQEKEAWRTSEGMVINPGKQGREKKGKNLISTFTGGGKPPIASSGKEEYKENDCLNL